MRLFGLTIMTGKAYRAEQCQQDKVLLDMEDKLLVVEFDRGTANRQIARLLHNGVELTLLWAAVRVCGLEDRVRVVYERLIPKEKGVKS